MTSYERHLAGQLVDHEYPKEKMKAALARCRPVSDEEEAGT
jgi:hypothetical protein